ncbi:MAG: membrane protein insertion efficiency factor YidD [Candidatus Thiodiazotropha endolucinida]
MINTLLSLFIKGYKRWISPYKGYRCAYAAYHNDMSCSDYGLKILKESGWRKFIKLMYVRFKYCYEASLAINSKRNSLLSQNENDSTDDEDNVSECNPIEDSVSCCINIFPSK